MRMLRVVRHNTIDSLLPSTCWVKMSAFDMLPQAAMLECIECFIQSAHSAGNMDAISLSIPQVYTTLCTHVISSDVIIESLAVIASTESIAIMMFMMFFMMCNVITQLT